MSPGWQGTDELLTREIAAATQRLLGARDTAEVHELRGYITALQSFQQDVREARDKLAKQGQDVPL